MPCVEKVVQKAFVAPWNVRTDWARQCSVRVDRLLYHSNLCFLFGFRLVFLIAQ